MSILGGFSEEAFEEYQRLVAEKEGIDFSEGDVYDFTRCMRADGSFYGTRGSCKKGSQAGAKEKAAPKTEGGRKRGDTARVRKADKSKPSPKPRASSNDLRTQQQALFDTAKQHRAAAKAAEKAHKENEKKHKGSKTPESRKSLQESGRAWDKANAQADRSQRAWMKAHERWSKAAEREGRAKMSPSQRKEARNIDKIIKERG